MQILSMLSWEDAYEWIWREFQRQQSELEMLPEILPDAVTLWNSTDCSHVHHLERHRECERGTEDAYASWIDETEQKGTNDDFTVLSRRHWATLQIGMLLYELHMIYRRQKVSATPTIEVKKSKGLPWWLSGKTPACQSKERQVQSLIQEDPTGHGATKPMHHNY